MPTFSDFAGQFVANGVRPNEPLVALEQGIDRTVYSNLATINGLIPKISKTLIRESRIRGNPYEELFVKRDLPFGVGWEDAQFKSGVANKKWDGTCVPRGSADMSSQLNILNFAWNIPLKVYDREINKAVLTPEETGEYAAQKMRLMNKTLAEARYRAMQAMVADVVDGTRSIASTDSSDGTGTSVIYNPAIVGYAGHIESLNFDLPPLSGAMPEFENSADAVELIKSMQDITAQMYDMSTNFNILGNETMLLDKPKLIIESRVLNAMDNVLALDGTDKRIPTRDAREFIRTFADIVEIPEFAALPDNSNYSNKRLVAVLADRDSFTEMVAWENTES